MTEFIKKINEIKTIGALECAVAVALDTTNNVLNPKVADAIHNKLEELKTYSGLLIGRGYDFDADVYYLLLINNEVVDQCIIYNEDDYCKLDKSISQIDIMLPITITGSGILKQGKSEIQFNTALNNKYIEE